MAARCPSDGGEKLDEWRRDFNGPRQTEPSAVILLRRGMTILIALWCLLLLAVWIPHYLTWPWFCDHEHFAMLARSWQAGQRPYRDIVTNQFPGEIYLFWLLGNLAGWGNTIAIYALDAALVIGLGLLLVLWGWRLSGRLLPGLIGFSSFLLYYLSVRFDITAQRETQVAALALSSLLMPAIWPGHGGRIVSAVAFGLALSIRPQVVVFLPAILWSLDRSARPADAPWHHTLIALLTWVLIAGLAFSLCLLPLALNGILIDCWNGLRAMHHSYGEHPTRGGILGILTNVHPLTLPKALLLTTLIVVGLRLWDRPGNPTRRHFPVVLAAMVGVAFYHAISPLRIAYHATPQMAVAAVGLTLAAARLVQCETRPLLGLAALGVLFLLFGARERPRCLEVLTPGDRTYGLGESLRILASGDLPLRPALGFYENPGYTWEDTRATILYMRKHVPPDLPVALLLMLNRAATVSVTGRTSALPVPDGNHLLMLDDPPLLSRTVAALERTDSGVVVWNPSHPITRVPKFQPLWEVIRRRSEREARFGNIEIWRRRSDTIREADTGSHRAPVSG
jgi:hypothetical protein